MEIVQQLGAIAVVFSLLGVAVWWVRSRCSPSLGTARLNASQLQIMGHIRLTAHHSVHILKVGDRELTIAVHPAGCTLLATRTPAEEQP